MLGTNRQFDQLIHSLDGQIAKLERCVVHGAADHAGALLEELWVRRRSLRLLVLNRRVEAAKPVVDFARWRDGNGAIYLCASPLPAKRKARR